MRRRLIVIDEASPILNMRDAFASLIIAAHFVLRAARAVLRTGLVFVWRCRRRAGWWDGLGFCFGFGFVCGWSSSGFPFSVCILLFRVFRERDHSYRDRPMVWVGVSILGLGSVAPHPFLFRGVPVWS